MKLVKAGGSADTPVGTRARGGGRAGLPTLSTGSGLVCLHLILVLLALVLVANPLVVGLFVPISSTRTVYLLLFDLLLLADIWCALHFIRHGRRRHLAGTFGLLIALPVVMLLAEPAIVATSELAGSGSDPSRDLSFAQSIHRPDPLLGWAPIPGASSRHTVEGLFDVTYRLDEKGRRATPNNPGAKRTVHFFGDSFAFGHGVASQDLAVNLVASALGSRANVANWAVMGYGIEQMFLRLREVQNEINRDDVVIFLPIARDLLRNMIDRNFICEIYSFNYSKVKNFPFFDGKAWRSADLDEACPQYRGDLLVATIERRLFKHRARGEEELIIENADKIFAQAKALAERRGARFEILFLVEMSECRSGHFMVAIDRLRTPHATLMAQCPATNELDQLVFPVDNHPNPAGHRWLANAILGFLDDEVLAGGPPASDDG